MRLAPLALCLAACTSSMTPEQQLAFILDDTDEPESVRQPPPPPAEPRLRDGPKVPPPPLRQVASVASPSIGDASDRVLWLSRNARFAALGRLSNGGPACGSVTDAARHDLHDLDTDTHEAIDRIVARDPRGRYLVFHTGPHLWLLDSDTGTRSELPARGVALADASDPCNIGRRAAFDAVGRHLVYLRGARSHEQVIWHDLASGRELIVQVPNSAGPIWRAEPSVTPGWVRVFSVPQDTDADGRRRIPRTRRISRGDEVVSLTLHVGDDPRPTVGDDPRPIVGPGGPSDDGFSPIGGGMFAAMFHRRPPLLATTGSAPAVPPGCDHHIGLPTDLDGVRLVPLECHEELRLWWPQSHHDLPLPAGRLVDAPTQLDADDHLWRAAQLELRPHETHIVRVDTDTAIALTGPRVLLDVVEPGQEPIRTDRAGWLYFNNPAGLLAFHITTGETRVHLGVIARELRPGAAQLLGRWYALDPARARMHALERAPTVVAENGCAVVGSGKRGDHGPWTRHCPQP